jgi:hypothetical protein
MNCIFIMKPKVLSHIPKSRQMRRASHTILRISRRIPYILRYPLYDLQVGRKSIRDIHRVIIGR